MDIFWNTNFLYGQSIVEENHQLWLSCIEMTFAPLPHPLMQSIVHTPGYIFLSLVLFRTSPPSFIFGILYIII